jgi:transcriptional regulator with XRE-family HTH domain
MRLADGRVSGFLTVHTDKARLPASPLALSGAVRRSRVKRKHSRLELAQRMKSNQSRIAKIEAGDPSVSLDLIVRALIASGASTRDIQAAFAAG